MGKVLDSGSFFGRTLQWLGNLPISVCITIDSCESIFAVITTASTSLLCCYLGRGAFRLSYCAIDCHIPLLVDDHYIANFNKSEPFAVQFEDNSVSRNLFEPNFHVVTQCNFVPRIGSLEIGTKCTFDVRSCGNALGISHVEIYAPHLRSSPAFRVFDKVAVQWRKNVFLLLATDERNDECAK